MRFIKAALFTKCIPTIHCRICIYIYSVSDSLQSDILLQSGLPGLPWTAGYRY